MKFGRSNSVEGLTFELPPDHDLTNIVLGGKRSRRATKIYVGCPVWADRKMVGILYPKGTKPTDYLRVYSSQLNAIELNATGYGTPSDDEILGWRNSVGKEFRFCPKVPRQISHTNPIGKNDSEVRVFVTSLKLYVDQLGPVLLQLSPHFSSDRIDQLWDFCDRWDVSYSLQLELRHPSWFSESAAFQAFAATLRKRKIGLAITDVSDRRDVLHQCLTTKTAFIRFDGHDLDPSDFKRLDEWVARIASWIEDGLESLYFFVHTPEKHLNPYLADYFIDKLNDVAGLELKRPTLLRSRDPA
jgi:uncharacterized protein YecE (DUF72 family)